MGLAPARSRIQLAFTALESSLSLKRCVQHELVFKTLESDRKAILPAIKDQQPKHDLLAAALMANATQTAALPDRCSRFPRSNATDPMLHGIDTADCARRCAR